MNFTFSIILNTSFLAIQHQFYLNIFTSLAIRSYLLKKGCEDVTIKWPNDLYHNSGKIGGILVENQLSGNRFSSSVVGIGLNVNQRQFEVKSATSMSLILDHELDLASELEILLHAIEIRYFQLRSGDLGGLMQDYLQALHWRDELHTFRSKGQSFTGRIHGIDPTGRLVVLVNNKEQFFDVREISYEQ
jgi:BirA family biotin operon repressor/biotin-[acetyl-CoA-carboxylase] ligase